MTQSTSAASALGGLGKFTELRQRLVFVILALIVYRIGSYIPVPGIDPEAMLRLMETRLQDVQRQMNESLHGTSTRTARSLGELQQVADRPLESEADIAEAAFWVPASFVTAAVAAAVMGGRLVSLSKRTA